MSFCFQYRGSGRWHVAHRRLLSPASHVWGQEPAVRLHPVQNGQSCWGHMSFMSDFLLSCWGQRQIYEQKVFIFCYSDCLFEIRLLFWNDLQDLGLSAGSKRPTCVILIKPHPDYQDAYDECLEEVSNLPKPLWANQDAPPNSNRSEPIRTQCSFKDCDFWALTVSTCFQCLC